MKYLMLTVIILTGCGAKPSPEPEYFCWKGTLYNTDSKTPVYEKNANGVYVEQKCLERGQP